MFGWFKPGRATRAIPEPLWQDVLERHPFLAERAGRDLPRLRELAGQFLASKEFHGAAGFDVSDEMAVAIAAQAVLPVLHLGLAWYDDFVGIVVHAGEVLAQRTVTDEDGVVHHYDEVLAGEAMDGGPVMLSWQDVEAAGDSAEQGYNVVIHEFAHKLDMRDGEPDGCPPLANRAARQAWLAVMQAEYESFREKVIIAERFGGESTWLDPYGAQSIDEFFAVTCEAWFVNRQRFMDEFPRLTLLFERFFGL
ncbi:zinc-dependent peptidase [uncultured Ramlibacter sp.]|uniref:M90 family metallopeptidase n=1 Tax=uncultured Ramlibacter sp. TaxID=260755 RepID=UPI00260C12F3|nr:M90 family metallopeptidase [uncultured Ramlibacter sp.]